MKQRKPLVWLVGMSLVVFFSTIHLSFGKAVFANHKEDRITTPPSNKQATHAVNELERKQRIPISPTATPTISSFSPAIACPGSTVNIVGTDFTGATAVRFGGVAAASFVVNSATSISAVVAAGGVNGVVTVTTPSGTATSATSFSVGSGTVAYAYMTNYADNNVSIVNTSTGVVSSTLAVGATPSGVAVNPSATRVYIANSGDNTISVINTSTNTVSATITVGTQPVGIVVSPDGSKLYVTNFGENTVSVINTSTNTVTTTLTVGSGPTAIVIAPDGTKVYVANSFANTVSVINTSNNTVSTPMVFTAFTYPAGLSINSTGTVLYVANQFKNTVSFISTASNTITKTVAVGKNPIGLTLSSDNATLYVANNGGNSVSVVNTTTATATATVNVGSAPFGLSVTPDGSKVYVANNGGNTVSVINTSNNTAGTSITVGGSPFGFGNFMASVVTPCLPTISSFTPTTAALGTTVTISGTNLSGATGVKFGGVAATSFSVINSTTITAVVGSGATGDVAVTTSGGTATKSGFTFCTNVTPSVTISASAATICSGSSVTFTAVPTNGGSSPSYQWKKFNTNVGTNSATFTTSTLANGDSILCVMTANNACQTTPTATSKLIGVSVYATPASPFISGGTCVGSTLQVTPSNNLSQIDWRLNGNTISSVTNFGSSGNTFAGGNGSGSGVSQLNLPIGVMLDNAGNVYVSDGSNNRVVKWAPGASTGVVVAGGNGAGNGLKQLQFPEGIYVDGSNSVYVADNNNHRVVKWTSGASAGVLVAGGNGQGSAANQLNYPDGIYVDANATIYIADAFNHRIQKWTAGATTGVTVAGTGISGSGASQLNSPLGVFVDGVGTVYIADFNNHRVQKWTAGASSGVTVAGGNGQGSAANQLNNPTSVYADEVGNVYVSDYGNHRVQKWTVGATTGVTVAGGNGNGITALQLSNPNGIYLDGSGNLYVADGGNNRVQGYAAGAIKSNSYTTTAAGTYTAKVYSTGGCAATSGSVVVNATVKPSISISSSGASTCAGTTVFFTAVPTNGGTSPIYQWKINGVNIAGAMANTYSSNSLPNNSLVSCALTSNAACASPTDTTSNFIFISYNSTPNLWTGNTSTDWSVASNWCSNTVPTSGADINIPVVSNGRYPALASNTTIGSINLAAGASLQLNGKTLTINGAVAGTGVLKGSTTSGLVVNSSSTSTFYFNKTATDTLLGTLTISGSGGAKLGNGLGITSLLSLNAGNLDLNGNNLTLESTSISATAVVGSVTNGATIAGKVTVERFIPKGFKAYRQLSAGGVYNAGSFFNNWQEGGNKPSGYGTHIIGNKSTTAGFNTTTGLDNTVNGKRGLFIYTNGGWDSIGNTKTTNIDPCMGYHIGMFGDRTVNLYQSNFDASSALVTATTIRTTGQLLTGSVTYTSTSTTGSFGTSSAKLNTANNAGSLVGNPYACAIDWHSLTKTGLTNSYYYFDPTFLISNSYQVFVSYNATSGTNSNPGNSKINRYIQPGQAFWVENTASSGTRQLVISESNKVTNQAYTAVFASEKRVNRLAITLWKNIPSKGNTNIDGAVAVFDAPFTTELGDEDTKKMPNSHEDLAILAQQTPLAINGQPAPKAGDRMLLQLDKLVPGVSYELRLDGSEWQSEGLTAYLVDQYLQKETPLGSGVLHYTFTSASPSNNEQRFSIVFSQKPASASYATTQILPAVYAVYPNPVVGKKATLSLTNVPAGKYTLAWYNAMGQCITKQPVYHAAGSGNITYPLSAINSKGFFNLQLTNDKGEVVYTQSVLVVRD